MLIPAIFFGSVFIQDQASQLPLRAQLAPIVDTYLDPASPNTNFGREPSLVLGNNRAILINFPELQWTRYSGHKLKNAQLVLTMSRGTGNIELSVSSVTKGWQEGSGRIYRFDKLDPAVIPWGSATWNHAQTGKDGIKWNESGAKATQDARPVAGVATEIVGKELIVKGLTQAIQNQLDNPFQNHGLRIETSSDVAFFSGEWTQERPRLELEWEETSATGGDIAIMCMIPGQEAGSYTVIYKNVGSEPLVASQINVSGTGLEQLQFPTNADPLAPGATKSITVKVPAKSDPLDPRKSVINAQILAPNDTHLGNNSIEYFVNGESISFEIDEERLELLKTVSPGGEVLLFYQQIAARLNHFVLPFSRFISAPEGAFNRFNVSLDPLNSTHRIDLNTVASVNSEEITRTTVRGLIPLGETWRKPPSATAPWLRSQEVNLSWLPDTRDDGLRIPGLELPVIGFDESNNPVPLWNNGLISRTEVAYLQMSLGKKKSERSFPWDQIQPGLLIHAMGALGENLVNTEVSFYRPGEPTAFASANSANGGFVFFAPEAFKSEPLFKNFGQGESSWILVKAARNGATAFTWLPAWQLLDWSVRGNKSMPNIELRFILPTQALDDETNIAKEKVVTDSKGRFPAQLLALVNEDVSDSVELEPGQWLEIDLSRDRVVGKMDFAIQGSTLSHLEIFCYGTSQTADSAIRWVGLSDMQHLADLYGSQQGNTMSVPIVHAARSMRYVRIVNRGQQTMTFADIKIYPVKS